MQQQRHHYIIDVATASRRHEQLERVPATVTGYCG
jgi:hypothetical protein